MRSIPLVCLTAALAAPIASCATAQPALPPTPIADLMYDSPFFPGVAYDAAIPTPESVLGFRPGDRAAKHAEIERVFKALAESSDRATLFTHGVTHEGRTLYHLAISSPDNIRRLDAIKADLAKLADPRTLRPREGDRLVQTTPAVAWLGYSIHGDEISGADAALAVAHHFIAATDDATRRLLDTVVVVIDPMMNPDGRDRYLQMVAEHRAANPNVDDQSLLHGGYWPAGRGNHYLFDLNRDWIFATQPESRGRIAAVSDWRPMLFVDAHEMGPQDTYLFSPAREPINPNIPESRGKWLDVFSKDQAAAFDRRGWRYYTGEWSENWYPGYSDAWATYRGAVGILYEMAGLTEDGVLRPEGRVMTYREAVHQQAVSSVANVATLAANREAILRDFLRERTRNIAGGEPGATPIVWAILPTDNEGRRAALLDTLRVQGIEMYVAQEGFSSPRATDQIGRNFENHAIPAGTVLIPAAQPEAPLARALLEFDPRMTEEFLESERRELLRFGRSRLYDITGWNLTMLYSVEALTLEQALPANAVRLDAPSPSIGGVDQPDAPVGFVIPGVDDRAVVAAARLLERSVQVRVADEPFRFDETDYPRGSIVIARADNRDDEATMLESLGAVCAELGVRATGFASGLAPGDLADLGGSHFILLNRPRVAIVTRTGVSTTNSGSAWFTIDHRLGIRATLLDSASVAGADLRRYNVMVLPSAFGAALDARTLEQLSEWVRAGGTLIASGSSARRLAHEDSGLSSVRQLPDVLDDLTDYRVGLVREWRSRSEGADIESLWSAAPGAADDDPLAKLDPPKAGKEELERSDGWRSIFMPQGAIVAGRVDDKHWLTSGAGGVLPVIFGNDPILMTDEAATAAVRVGAWTRTTVPQDAGPEPAAGEGPGNSTTRADGEPEPSLHSGTATNNQTDGTAVQPGATWIGWGPTPPGHELRVRMSGLLWPEAARRIANAAYATVENRGRGQVILFASAPTFRAASMGTTRLFLNAVVFGPGFASSHILEP